ncbi:MAG: HepT-like ribonuclease domain-containing protein [Xanthobacteraceae bacterium]
MTDIIRNIDLARSFVEGLTYEAILADIRTVYATTRCLEIISEASRRLPNDMKARYPSIPWADIAGAGNIYRHNYEDVLEKVLWHTIHHALAPLRAVVENELIVRDL